MTHRTFAVPLALAALLTACDGAPSGPDRHLNPSRDLAVAGPWSADRFDAGPRQGEPQVFRFRSVEDPATPPDAAVCAAAPFAANVLLGASLWTEAVTAAEGRLVNDRVRRIGTATACVQITHAGFPPGRAENFHVQFHLAEGVVTATGACSVISNDVPEPGLVLAGCHLTVTDAPARYTGGAVTSLSIFNPAGLPQYATGSEWTLRLYPAG